MLRQQFRVPASRLTFQVLAKGEGFSITATVTGGVVLNNPFTPAVSGIRIAAGRGGKSEVAHKWAKWVRHPCRLEDPHPFRAGGEITSGPQVGKVATSTLPFWGSPPLQSGGQNQKWPTCGQSGYVTPTVSGIPTATGRGGKSEVALKWAKWLRHPSRLGDPHRFRAGGGNQKWPTSGQSGYVTPAVSGIPTASERGGKSEVAHLWAKWLRHPCRLEDPHRYRARREIRSGPLVGKVATSPLPSRGSPPLRSGGQNQKWPTCGQSGYVTPTVSGIPTAPGRGEKSEVALKWAKWLRHPCRLGDPHRFRAGGEIRSGPLVGKVAMSPLPSRGSPPLQVEGGNQKWPTCGQSGYVTPALSGIPTASERGAKSEVAHLWAKLLRHPYRLADPHRYRARGEIRSGPQVGKVATSPLPSRGSPLHGEGGNQKWPTCGQSGHVNPSVSGIPTASERGGKSEVAHKWAKWLCHPCLFGDPHRFRAGGKIRRGPLVGQSGYVTPTVSGIPTATGRGGKSEVALKWAKWLRHPCRVGDPHRFREGGKIRSGPLVGKVATSPLPSRGSPPLQSGGRNQKWPTSGQSGYVTPAVSGIPTASERGAKSEVAHLWAKWLGHPCRLGDPHRFRARGKIRSGPLVGKVATSTLPSRGSPPLQRGGGNQKWPTCGQSGYVTPTFSGIPTASERGAK